MSLPRQREDSVDAHTRMRAARLLRAHLADGLIKLQIVGQSTAVDLKQAGQEFVAILAVPLQ